MWVAKVKINGEKSLLGSRTVKYGVDMFGYPVSHSRRGSWIFVQIVGNLFGNKKSIKEFIKSLKSDKRVLNIELKNDFFIGAIKESASLKPIYNEKIFYVKPSFISKNGYEIGYLASFNKKDLMNIIKMLTKSYQGKLLSIQQKNIKSISLSKISPELTEKQKMAINLAIEYGYYNVPRDIDLQQLARIAKLSFSTFQVHLRKAESKLIPFSFE